MQFVIPGINTSPFYSPPTSAYPRNLHSCSCQTPALRHEVIPSKRQSVSMSHFVPALNWCWLLGYVRDIASTWWRLSLYAVTSFQPNERQHQSHHQLTIIGYANVKTQTKTFYIMLWYDLNSYHPNQLLLLPN